MRCLTRRGDACALKEKQGKSKQVIAMRDKAKQSRAEKKRADEWTDQRWDHHLFVFFQGKWNANNRRWQALEYWSCTWNSESRLDIHFLSHLVVLFSLTDLFRVHLVTACLVCVCVRILFLFLPWRVLLTTTGLFFSLSLLLLPIGSTKLVHLFVLLWLLKLWSLIWDQAHVLPWIYEWMHMLDIVSYHEQQCSNSKITWCISCTRTCFLSKGPKEWERKKPTTRWIGTVTHVHISGKELGLASSV